MKLIDNKGKLFGLINIIDLLVLIVIIAIVGALGYRMTRKGPDNVPAAKQDVYLTVNCIMIPEEAAMTLLANEGKHMVAKNAYQSAVIESVTYRPADYVGEDENGNAVLSEHPIWKTATVVIKDQASPADAVLKIGGQEARIGYKYTVKTQLVEIQGTVTGIEFGDQQ